VNGPRGNLHSDQGREIMELFRSLDTQGTTIVQVTYSQHNAACGRRVVRLADGWLVREPAVRAGRAAAHADRPPMDAH
jgi:ABC-type ATPase involved in cell division